MKRVGVSVWDGMGKHVPTNPFLNQLGSKMGTLSRSMQIDSSILSHIPSPRVVEYDYELHELQYRNPSKSRRPIGYSVHLCPHTEA